MQVTIDLISSYHAQEVAWISGVMIFEYDDNRITIDIDRKRKKEKDNMESINLADSSKIFYLNGYHLSFHKSVVKLPNKYNIDIEKVMIRLLNRLI